jgi:hypothetical protein
MKTLLKKLDKKIDSQIPLLLLLTLIVVLRIPGFFEPYWYGDEAIYLTLGHGIKSGLKLYSEIIDHKTPLIYYFAALAGNQMGFRLLNVIWMLFTTTAFFQLSKTIFKRFSFAILSSLVFIFLTTMPWFEGHIPNGELFVLGFVLWGAVVITKTKYYKNFIENKDQAKFSTSESPMLLGAGALFSLGMLTKVPALLDLAAFFSIGYFAIFNQVSIKKIKSSFKSMIWPNMLRILVIGSGALIPIIISIAYFILIGSGKDYLGFGLLYNIRYSGSWQLDLNSSLLSFLFTLKGKIMILAGSMIVLAALKNKIKPKMQLILAWFGLTMFAALLSNRPYPHYFIQVFAPLSLLIIKLVEIITIKFCRKTELILGLFNIGFFISILLLLNVGLYSTQEYYQKFYRLMTNQMSLAEYNQSFDSLVADNYEVAKLIKKLELKEIFIWGTNPMLYAQTQTNPTARFTVSFHIKDFNAYLETFDKIEKAEPKLIVVMNNEKTPFPKLENYLKTYYIANHQYKQMTLYLRNSD